MFTLPLLTTLLWVLQLATALTNQTFSKTISIQTVNETYYSYLPLSNCTYPTNKFSPGRVQYSPLDPLTIFQSIQVADQVFFWGAMTDGSRMLVNQGELLQNGTYSQVVLFNSSLQTNLSQRELILVTFTGVGQIVFTYAYPAYNYSSNVLTPSLVSQQTFVLGLDIQLIVRDCNQAGSYVRIAYIGNDTYMGVCPNTSKLFAWTATNTTTTTQTYIYTTNDLSFLAGDSIQNITNSPYVLFPDAQQNVTLPPVAKQYSWNVVLLTQNGSSAYFCAANLSGLQCESFEDEQNWLQIVIERGWGLESSMEITQIQFILAQFPEITSYNFPGNIVSVFSYSATIFVESNDNSSIFLAIFENGNILANVSLSGEIIYYGRENLVVEDNNTFWIVDFLLPMYDIAYSPADPNKNVSNLTVVCNSTEYILNFDIFWSNIAFPSFLIQQTNSTPLVSYQSVKIQNLNDYYQIIGPAFDIFIDLTADIDINLMDISALLGIDEFIDIINILFVAATAENMVPSEIIFIDIAGVLKRYQLSSQLTIQMNPPCGFSSIRGSFPMQNGFVFSDSNQLCYCNKDVTECQIVPPQHLPALVSQNTQSLGQYSISLSNIMQSLSSTPSTPISNGNAIKKQLLTVVNQDLIVNIYQNNSVSLTNFQGDVIYIISGICDSYNSTDGTIFTRNFYDDFLILYCYKDPTITQYLIRNETFLFNRIIPIYGFLTTSNTDAILAGQNYVFLEVDFNPQFFGDIKYKTDTTTCCILRLDPDQFTVSVIAEVIPANKLITVYSIFSVDVVFYNETDVSSEIPFIKVYFDSSWIAFSQSTVCTPNTCSSTPNTYFYNLSIISNIYNFAAAYNQNITFNVSASFITFSGSTIQDVEMEKYVGNYVSFNSSVQYNFNNFCGPIGSFSEVNKVKQPGGIFSIQQNDIIIANKEITHNYEPILQVLDIADFAPNNTLAACVLVVGIQNLTFYLKYGEKWMDTLQVIESTQENCLYFVSQIINETAIQLASNCYNLIISNPTLTIVYNATLGALNYSFGTMELPMQLRSVVSFIQDSQTYLLGIEEGPSKSASGVFYLCSLALCNSLTINSKIVFFIDFDQQLTPNGVLVVGLDVFNVSFWINPTKFPLGGNSVPADYVTNYQSYLSSSCSKVKIVSASFTQANIILSCGTFYKQLIIEFSNKTITLTQVMTFDKFSNCQAIDRFKPEIILKANTTATIELMAVECQQSVNIVRLEEIYAINTNSSINIITGYLLIYSSTGPRCSPSRWSPIRMIQLGTSEQMISYLIYQANSYYKILYEQISGILIDNFIEMQPNSYYELIELTKQVVYPSINMTIQNPYYNLALTVLTSPQKAALSSVLFYIVLSCFILFNVVTMVCFACWCYFRKASRRLPLLRFFQESISNPSVITGPSNNSNVLSDKSSRFSSNYDKGESSERERRQQDHSNLSRGESVQHSLKRKGTEIELFQPR